MLLSRIELESLESLEEVPVGFVYPQGNNLGKGGGSSLDQRMFVRHRRLSWCLERYLEDESEINGADICWFG